VSDLFDASRLPPSPPADPVVPVEVFDTICEQDAAVVGRRRARAAAKDSGHSVQPDELGAGAILAEAAPE